MASSSSPCVLVVADPGRVGELADALREPLPQGAVEVVVSSGGDDTIELFEARRPRIVVLTASLEVGDAKSLIEVLRELVPREEVGMILVGDDETGPVRNALDAIDMKPDRFVGRPLSVKALRFAVGNALDTIARALGEESADRANDAAEPAVDGGDGAADAAMGPAEPRTSTPVRGSGATEPRRSISPTADLTADAAALGEQPGIPRVSTAQRGSGPLPLAGDAPFVHAAAAPRFSSPVETGDVPTVVPRAGSRPVAPTNGDAKDPAVGRAPTDRGTGITMKTASDPAIPNDPQPMRAALRARWEALADSIGGELDEDELEEETAEHTPAAPAIEIGARKKGSTNPDFMPVPPMEPWRPGTAPELPELPGLPGLHEQPAVAPQREPTLILHDEPPVRPSPSTTPVAAIAAPPAAPPGPAAEPARQERWSQPVLLSELIDRSRDSSRELLAHVSGSEDLSGFDELDDDLILGHPAHTPPPHVLRGDHLEPLDDFVEVDARPSSRDGGAERPAEPPARPSEDRIGGRDFARQLRAKMSMMAQRLFQSGSQTSPASVDVRPRHDHHTEIDLAALGEEPALSGGVTEIVRSMQTEPVQVTTSPGTWDTQVRERGLPDSGEIVRGVSDTAMILARMFAIAFTGRVGFRRDEVEKVVYFDQGRPVFASSNEPGDRMGELLVREGKITASQYERCQVVVAESGRRMGEILVDFGYLKRRELLPAVRRHVEDIVYSLFGWDHGHYHVTADPTASAERIRLSRHPASLVLEGIRRKQDRSTLERLLGPPSTVIEVADRERLGGILDTGDLAGEERAALAAFDGQADLAQVARATGSDIADVLPLAWGLCVLGLATARRAESELEESTALVGETDLAIDRERVRARWQLVTEADYFALLGVRRDATGFEIRRAYQAARRDFAPDGFPTDLRRELARELEDIASVLDEAFRVLRDDRLRQTYLANLFE